MYKPKLKRHYTTLNIQHIDDIYYAVITLAARAKRMPISQVIIEALLNEYQPKFTFGEPYQYYNIEYQIKIILNSINECSVSVNRIHKLIHFYWKTKAHHLPDEQKIHDEKLIPDFQHCNLSIKRATDSFLKFNSNFTKEFNLSGHTYDKCYSSSTYHHLQRMAVKGRKLVSYHKKLIANAEKLPKDSEIRKKTLNRFEGSRHIGIRVPRHLYIVMKAINKQNDNVGYRPIVEASVLSSPTIPHVIMPLDQAKNKKLSKKQAHYQHMYYNYYRELYKNASRCKQLTKGLQNIFSNLYKSFSNNPKWIIEKSGSKILIDIDNYINYINIRGLSVLAQNLSNLHIKG